MRKGGLILLIGSFLIASSCGNKHSAPAHLMSRDKMEDVLWDLMRADLFINNYMVIKDTALDKKKQGIQFYSQILKMHKVTQEQFRESFLYYRSKPLELKDLMDSLSHRTDSQQLRKATLTPLSPDSVKKDSLPVMKAE